MTRTKLVDRILPNYTRKEEWFNSISHIVGGGLGVIALFAVIIKGAWFHHSLVEMIALFVYGIGNITLYCMSSIYHGLEDSLAKRVFQVLDHCTIYIMIAGTYTAICVLSIAHVSPLISNIILLIEWGLAALAITLTAIDLKKFRVFSMTCNLVMGWAIILAVNILIEATSFNCFMLILMGGVFYTVGAILYGVGRKKSYMHCVFHIFVLIGSILHFLAIYLFMI